MSRTARILTVAAPATYAVSVAGVTWMLLKPAASPADFPIGLGQAAFTAISAICLAGLTVRDTASHFSAWGQGVLAGAMAAGALLSMFFGGLLAMALAANVGEAGGSAGTRARISAGQAAGVAGWSLSLLAVLAGLGAAGLLPWGMPHRSGGWWSAPSVFHAVSAWSNGGLSNLPEHLRGYRYAAATHLVVAPLMVLGGLGLPVLRNLLGAGWASLRRRATRLGEDREDPWLSRGLTTHTKLVLTMTAMLYVGGVLLITAGQLKPYLNRWLQQGQEGNVRALPGLSLGRIGGTLADASFACITARSAGLQTEPIERLEPLGQATVLALMAIGASPAGTGGGLKTTVVAVLVLAAWGAVRGRRTRVFGCWISDDVVRLALALAVFYAGLIGGATLLLTLSEPFPFLSLLFESTSAASSCGLSLGVTPSLTATGKGVIAGTMFLGRVGPLTLLAMMLIHPPIEARGQERAAFVALV